ncbi:MAG: polyprenyl synthetase family protein [Planctomycetota bacterium]
MIPALSLESRIPQPTGCGVRPLPEATGGLEEALHEPAERFLSRFGKRVRASMVDQAFQLAGGTGQAPSEIVEGIELLHAGSLIIDDIEDDSLERRGRPTLHRELGVSQAINTGNWMYFRSLEKFGECRSNRNRSGAILKQVIRTARRCHEGQALDLSSMVHRLHPSKICSTALSISRLKTGGLTGLASWLGAVSAGAGRTSCKHFGRFGVHIGIALQMHNDLSELRRFFGGETRCDDLRHARVTWPWAWAVEEGRLGRVTQLQAELFGRARTAKRLRSIAGQLVDLVDHRGEQAIERRLQRAVAALSPAVESVDTLSPVLDQFRTKFSVS